MFIYKIAVAAAALAICATGAVAAPADDSQMISVKVSTSGINLNDPAGAKLVMTRIHNAAEALCGYRPDSRLLAQVAVYDSCVSQTVDRAVRSSHMPSLAQTDDGKTLVEASR